MTGKKRGPVPKPKGWAISEVGGFMSGIIDGGLLSGWIVVDFSNNDHASLGEIRKSIKKTIDSYFKELINEGEKRAQTGRISQETKGCGIPIQVAGVDKGRKEGTAGRGKGI